MREQEKVAKPPQLAQTGWCGQELFDHTTPAFRPPLLLLRRGPTPEWISSLVKPYRDIGRPKLKIGFRGPLTADRGSG